MNNTHMKQTKIRRWYYHARHHYFTTNNIVLVVGLLVAASWAWGSVQAMERNYALQKEVDFKQRQLELAKLQTDKLKFEQNYYESDEYKELAARDKLGLANPGEKVLILPRNSSDAQAIDGTRSVAAVPETVRESNLQQWANFLVGGSFRSLQR